MVYFIIDLGPLRFLPAAFCRFQQDHSLQEEMTGFVDGLDVGGKKKMGRAKVNAKIFF